VLDQSFEDFELIVISDQCEETKRIVKQFEDSRIVLLECKHRAIFDNLPRNTGIDSAKGEYIIYCDIDDFWGTDHLKIVNEELKNYDWVWYNDFVFKGDWTERACNIKTLGGCGTSNVCHKRSLGLKWDRPGYAHDFYFNQKLLNLKNGSKIETPEYFVCHVPGKGGWDL
jgi:glycosyltransferase involved in cell wall biosynthesis